jgi:GWxTD domain-containing protein
VQLRPPLLALALTLAAASLAAQGPMSAHSRFPDVDVALAAHDTVRALDLLGRAGMRGDAEAWYRRGVLGAHRMPMAQIRYGPISVDSVEGARSALAVEESLRNATRLAPDSARYWLRLARHQLWHRSGAPHHEGFVSIDSALGAAHRVQGAEGMGLAAYDAAMLFWRQWIFNDGRPAAALGQWEVDALTRDALAPLPRVRRYRLADVPSSRLGAQELSQATNLLALAADSAPDIALLRRRHYGALATVGAWEELRGVAARRARGTRADFVDLLALGLARQRVADAPGADSAFAAARRGMPQDERLRLTSILRALSRPEREAFGIIAPEERERIEERAWLLIDPMWRVPGNEVRSEFMARIAHAELRWGGGAEGSGVDSDPGIVWLGYGPPTIAHTMGGDGWGPAVGSALLVWRWPPNVQVQFQLGPGLYEERLLPGMRQRFDQLLDERGFHWSGVPGARGLDSIAVQSALFRAGPDSADLFIAARIPTDRLARGMAEQGTLALDLFILTNDGRLVRRDASRWALDAMQRRQPAMRVWRHRLPVESYLHRVEAYEPVEGRGARGASMPASLDDVAFRLHGFGTSQLLVTQAVASRVGAMGERWTDYNILPNPGDLHRSRSVSLLWEVYGDSATALEHYRVEVTLQPPTPAVVRALGLQARMGVVGSAARRAREKDRVSVAFERRHALPAAVRVEQVDLGAVKVSPGIYVLRVDVTDLATRRTVTTSRLVTVR